MTFDQWYLSTIGVTVEAARERGVYSIDLMQQCWEAAVKQARIDALEEAAAICQANASMCSYGVMKMTLEANAAAIESLKGKP